MESRDLLAAQIARDLLGSAANQAQLLPPKYSSPRPPPLHLKNRLPRSLKRKTIPSLKYKMSQQTIPLPRTNRLRARGLILYPTPPSHYTTNSCPG